MSDTLVIRHLPQELSTSEKEDFLRHFGATNVKIVDSKIKKSSLAFATFQTKSLAENILHRLHQLNVLGSRLTVEYCKHRISEEYGPTIKKEDEQKTKQSNFKAFLTKLNAFNASLDFTQPPPSHLKYNYPKPNMQTLTNIIQAMMEIPKFYIQVCHLMNRMHIPPPFSDVPDYVSNQMKIQTTVMQSQPHATAQLSQDDMQSDVRVSPSDSESELESDPEDVNRKTVGDIILKHRRKPSWDRETNLNNALKRIKSVKTSEGIPKLKKPKIFPEEVFVKSTEHSQRKIQLKVPAETKMDTLPGPSSKTNEMELSEPTSFGKIFPVKSQKTDDHKQQPSQSESSIPLGDAISTKELSQNRISPRDLHHLPVFNNYNAGPPSCRIYIKNLSKSVTTEDLLFIYRKYELPDYGTDEYEANFDIRLLQEGRMKGQAFVTLQNIEQAKKAVIETNGFILKEKPMVVVFARSAIAKPKTS